MMVETHQKAQSRIGGGGFQTNYSNIGFKPTLSGRTIFGCNLQHPFSYFILHHMPYILFRRPAKSQGSYFQTSFATWGLRWRAGEKVWAPFGAKSLRARRKILGLKENESMWSATPPQIFYKIHGRPHFPARGREVSPLPQSQIVLLLVPQRSQINFHF